MQEMVTQNVHKEDVIDIRDLFKIIAKGKVKIFLITSIVTILALLYVFLKTPIYEAQALVEIGSYKVNNNNIKIIDNASQLSRKLNTLYIDINKHKKDLLSKIVSIKPPKEQTKEEKKFLDIKSEGISNDEAVSNIKKVLKYIQKTHKKILDDVKTKREFEIATLQRKLDSINTNQLPRLDSKIKLYQQALKDYKKSVIGIDRDLKKIKDKNPALTALKLMEKRDILNSMLNINSQLLDVKSKKENLKTMDIASLEERITVLKSMLLPYNYKNSEIVGKILTDDYPSKPKKKLIVIVAFITGLMLSIFIVFFLEFLSGFREKEI